MDLLVNGPAETLDKHNKRFPWPLKDFREGWLLCDWAKRKEGSLGHLSTLLERMAGDDMGLNYPVDPIPKPD